MSGLKDDNLTLFYRKLHARRMTVGRLARKIFSSRAHVTQVLNGTRPGGLTWRKLERVLRADELELLRRREDVPRRALSHVEPVEAAQ